MIIIEISMGVIWMDRFNFIKTDFEGVLIIEPNLHPDHRGYFVKTFDEEEFKEKGLDIDFVQEDQSCSKKGVLRGMHFQKKHPQGKLVRVLHGKVFDVGVDLRKNSKTFGKWIGVILSHENQRQLFLPRGFAHGWIALEDNSVFLYKVDNIYYPDDQGGLIYDDEDIGIEWPLDDIENLIMAEKDKKWKSFKDLDFYF